MAVLAASIADTVAGMQRVLAKDAYCKPGTESHLRKMQSLIFLY